MFGQILLFSLCSAVVLVAWLSVCAKERNQKIETMSDVQMQNFARQLVGKMGKLQKFGALLCILLASPVICIVWLVTYLIMLINGGDRR